MLLIKLKVTLYLFFIVNIYKLKNEFYDLNFMLVLHFFFCLYCQFYLFQLYIHHIYSFAIFISYAIFNFIIDIYI